jgi:hypothetical protein
MASTNLSRRIVLIGVGAALIAPPALAHRSQSVLTTVEWNAAASKLEVIHRIHAHDAEVGLMQATKASGNLDLTQVPNQAKLILYADERFSLTDASGKIKLEPVGAQFESEAILLYMEAKRPAPPDKLIVADSILCDVFEQQTNLVNIRLSKKTRTLIFVDGDKPKPADGLL